MTKADYYSELTVYKPPYVAFLDIMFRIDSSLKV